jgi:protein-tyrosine-phosphatase
MPSILFVCTANRFRSPIAALYFAREVVRRGDDQDIHVSSAGTWASPEQSAMPKAVQLVQEYGLDLSYHKSRIVSEALLTQSDLILVMEAGHKEALTHEFPGTADRVYLLTEVVEGLDVNIPDPYGEAQSDPEEVVNEIVGLIDTGYEQLLSLAKKMENKRVQ